MHTGQHFSPLHVAKTGSEAHSLLPISHRGLSAAVMRLGREADHISIYSRGKELSLLYFYGPFYGP
jgi:hypothetical protein